mmetsp:Transcript_928/g.1222  ORF Transcript_928/g.1222 Transcript_928/m.1222 type:complete len:231 (+) Transcript_928:144-836(+)
MLSDMISYLSSSFLTPILLVKFSVLWLCMDVVNVAFAAGSDHDESAAALRLGLLFGGIGIGSFIGPLVAEQFTSMEKPETLQRACVVSIGVSAFTALAMGAPALPFWLICVLSAIRASGISAAWINSSLIIQKFCAPDMLGRVSSVEFGLALIAECSSAFIAGVLQDDYGWSPQQVCTGIGFLGLLFLAGWSLFHVLGKGAASQAARLLPNEKEKESLAKSDCDVESTKS